MKIIILALLFTFASFPVFAVNIYEGKITKENIKTNYTKELTSLKKDLVKKQQNSLQQEKQKYYQTIIDEINKAIAKALEVSEQSYQKAKNIPQVKAEYLNGFMQDIKAYKELQKSNAAVFIADYANKNFDITKISKLYAFCFSAGQITLDFEYLGKKARIVYLIEGNYIFNIVS